MSSDSKTEEAAGIHPVEPNTVVEEEFIEKKLTYNHDRALDLFEGSEEEFEYTAREERRLKWKLDLTLIPMVCRCLSISQQIYLGRVQVTDRLWTCYRCLSRTC
jgi:hypothetical protein